MNSEVCAVIVTHHPDATLERFLASLRPQVGALLIVDNRSTDEERAVIRQLRDAYSLDLIENSRNQGLGSALNTAVRWIEQRPELRFALFFDQDGFVRDGFVGELMSEYYSHSPEEHIYLVMPCMIDRDSGQLMPPRTHRGRYFVAQTAGSFVSIDTFSKAGYYDENLFIEWVDYEHCIRMDSRGYRIARSANAVLYHRPGHPSTHSLLGLRKVITSNSSPVRKYYLLRNTLFVLKEYGLRYPRWFLGIAWGTVKGMGRSLIFENNRRNKLVMYCQAVVDFSRSRYGDHALLHSHRNQ